MPRDDTPAAPQASAAQAVTPSAPQVPLIDAERAAHIQASIKELREAGVVEQSGLVLIFTAAGASVETVNKAAVAALTPEQASSVEKELFGLLSPIRDMEAAA
jgi:hypothetical protein